MRFVFLCEMSNTASPSPSVAETFALILDGLCRAVAARMGKRPANNNGPANNRPAIDLPTTWPLLMLLHTRLRRAMARFASLAERAAAGPLPPPRPKILRRGHGTRPGPRLPAGFAWLFRLLPGEAACFGSQLRHLISQPEMAALLDAAPQAGRILRPLCRMLAVPLPPALALTTIPAPPNSTTAEAPPPPLPRRSPVIAAPSCGQPVPPDFSDRAGSG